MILQQQPTRTSCGPTVVAMFAGRPASEVILRAHEIRKPNRLKRVGRTDRTNVGELARLLKLYGFSLGRRERERNGDYPSAKLAVLRISRAGGNWHWSALCDGIVFDPCVEQPMPLAVYRASSHMERRWLSWYDVTCANFCPPTFSAHWREWHRGHRCELDPEGC